MAIHSNGIPPTRRSKPSRRWNPQLLSSSRLSVGAICSLLLLVCFNINQTVKDMVTREVDFSERQKEQPPLVSPRQYQVIFSCIDTESDDDDNRHKSNDSQRLSCCASWNVDGDEWWLHHPDWEVSFENDTHYCFSPISDPQRAHFMRQLHILQWGQREVGALRQSSSSLSSSALPLQKDNIHSNNMSAPSSSNATMITTTPTTPTTHCSDFEKSIEINSGYGASTSWLMAAFWHAYKGHKPFQIVHRTLRWLYATNDTASWAYCASEDSRCYYLPISPCPRTETKRGEHLSRDPPKQRDVQLRLEYYWLKQYLFRNRQHFRHRLYQFRTQQLNLTLPCTTMHVRRGDAGLPGPPYRRYAAVQEYIDAAHIQPGETIFLLTDDESTIREAHHYHPEFDWVYLKRPRVDNITSGFNGHIPSGDESLELLVIETELAAASLCHKIVHGDSGYVKGLLEDMTLEGKNYTRYYVRTKVSKSEGLKFRSEQERLESLFRDMDMLRKNVTDHIDPNTTVHVH